MIKAKIFERMECIQTERWRVRFWFSLEDPFSLATPSGRAYSFAMHLKRWDDLTKADWQVMNLIAEFFEEQDKLAAAEVVDRERECGFVAYFEWP